MAKKKYIELKPLTPLEHLNVLCSGTTAPTYIDSKGKRWRPSRPFSTRDSQWEKNNRLKLTLRCIEEDDSSCFLVSAYGEGSMLSHLLGIEKGDFADELFNRLRFL